MSSIFMSSLNYMKGLVIEKPTFFMYASTSLYIWTDWYLILIIVQDTHNVLIWKQTANS